MKKSLLLALAFAAACGYAMAEEDTTTPAPATQEETTQPAPQEEETLDMDAMLDETEEAK